MKPRTVRKPNHLKLIKVTMHTKTKMSLLTLGLFFASAVHAQTVLNAKFDSDPLGRPPVRNLRGLPAADELLYLGTGNYLRVVPFPGAISSRATEIKTMPGSLWGHIELASCPLAPGARSRVHAVTVGRLASPVKFGSMTLSLSLNSSRLLAAVELKDGEVFIHELAGGGTTRARRPFATYRPGVTHSLAVDLDVITGKCHVTFQETGAPVYTSPTVQSPAAGSVANAHHVSLVNTYDERQPVNGAYLLDAAQIWVNHP